MKPELHYGETDFPVSTSESFPKHDELHFEIELIDFFKVKVISEDLGVVKKVISEGEGWETPREPYEIKASISAKTGAGKSILSRTQEEPYFFIFGKAEFLVKPPVKECTKPINLKLHSDIRAMERAEFDHYVAEKLSLLYQYKLELEKQQKGGVIVFTSKTLEGLIKDG